MSCSLTDFGATKLPERPYKPVVIVHGLMTGDVSTMQHLAARIAELHPGTKTYVINRFCGLASLEPLWRQTRQLANDLLQACSLHPEGVHVIGYSQGGLIARGMLQFCGAKHNVKTFVSLSSPQGGQYGAECFTKMFPALTTRTAYEVFYTRLGQHALSVANFWYDSRHRDLYLKYSLYLAVIDDANRHETGGSSHLLQNTTATTTIGSNTIANNNDDQTKMIEKRVSVAIAAIAAAVDKVAEHPDNHVITTVNADPIITDILVDDSNYYYYEDNSNIVGNSNSNACLGKLGLSRLQRLVLIGGPDDGVISPWQSSQFAIQNSVGEIVSLRERQQDDIFSDDDPIGLRQLDITGRIVEYTVPDIGHHEWHRNERVLRECIIDWLD